MIINITDVICENMPADPDDVSYSPLERIFYQLIIDSPIVEDYYKQNPGTAAIYFHHMVNMHKDTSEYSCIVPTEITSEYKYEYTEDNSYIIRFKRARKSPLRMYVEREYIKFVQRDTPVYIYRKNIEQFAKTYRFIRELWDYMTDVSLLDYGYWDEDWEYGIEFFEALDNVNFSYFEHFLEVCEYNSHEVMEYMLIFTGEHKLEDVCVK